jgi:hypothetical protein
MLNGAAVLATIAAVLASAGDLLLLAVANAVTPALAAGGASRAPALVCGYYLGVLAIPWYAVGYWSVGRRLPPRHGRIVAALGACGAVLGATIHGVTGTAIAAVQPVGAATADSGVDVLRPFMAYLAPLWAIVALATIAGSVAFAIPVMRGESSYPRWLALANPVAGIVVISACASFSAVPRALIVPASPNLAHVVFFGLVASMAGRHSDGTRA